MRRSSPLLFVLLDVTAAGHLKISGGDALISLGGASITSTCAGDAHVTFFAPQSILYDQDHTVRAYFHGVPHTCIDAPLRTPCVSPNPLYPALFYAIWSHEGGGAPVVKGPLKANYSLETTADGIHIGYQTWLDCPTPTFAELSALAGGSLVGSSQEFGLAVRHGFAPSGADARALPLIGLPNGSQITIDASKPPSSPPSMPPIPPLLPPLPPSSPPTSPFAMTTSVAINGISVFPHGSRIVASPSMVSANPWSIADASHSGRVKVELWGAGGGGMSHDSYSKTGGGGAYVSAILDVTAGSPLYVYIGTGGGGYPSGSAPSGGTPGGGQAGSGPNGAGGGGCTIVSTAGGGSPDQTTVLAVAGGGGGASRG